MLYRMSYAVNFLYTCIPAILDAGLGPWQIDAIQKLDKYALELFLERQDNNATPDDWKKHFRSALAHQAANKQWSYDELVADVLLILANNEVTEANRISFVLSARLEGLENNDKTTPVETSNLPESQLKQQEANKSDANNPPTQQTGNQEKTDKQNSSKSRNKETKEQSSSSHNHNSNQASTSQESADTSSHRQPLNTPDTSTNDSFTPSLSGFIQENLSSRQLRDKVFSLALQLASDNGFGGLIEPLPNLGVGFILKDLPSKSFMEGEKLFGIINKRPYKERIMVWWMLFGFSELRAMSINNPNAIAPLLPETDLKRALVNTGRNDQDKCNMTLERIFRRTGEFIIDDLVVYFWAVASESNIAGMLAFNLWEMKT